MRGVDLVPTVISLISQFWSIPNTYGGLSGQDSIWRAALAQMDYTLGILYLAGLCSIAFPGSLFHIERANHLHTDQKRDGHWVEDVDAIQLSFRHKFKAIATRKTRKGQLFLLPRSGDIAPTNRDPPSLLDNPRLRPRHVHKPSPKTLYFAPNYSMFIVPYMQDRHIRKDVEETSSIKTTVCLDRDVLRRTAARSVARFGILAASVILICVFRMALLFAFMQNRLKRYCLCLGEIGRCLMILSQESSVLTYSCAYKCVSTWASPFEFGRRWNDQEQRHFRNEVVQSMGNAYHARILLWCAERAFSLMGSLDWWQSRFGSWIFSCFNSPDQEAFSSENVETVQLRVSDQDALSPTWKISYEINFEAPTMLLETAKSRLLGDPRYLKAAALLLLLPALCAIFGPTMIWGNGREAVPAIVMFSLMQLAASTIMYQDLPDRSINCVFEDSMGDHSHTPNAPRPFRSAATTWRDRYVPSSSNIELTQIDPGPSSGYRVAHKENISRHSLSNDPHIGTYSGDSSKWEWEKQRVGKGKGKSKEGGGGQTDRRVFMEQTPTPRVETTCVRKVNNSGQGLGGDLNAGGRGGELRRENGHTLHSLARSVTCPQFPLDAMDRFRDYTGEKNDESDRIRSGHEMRTVVNSENSRRSRRASWF